MAALFAVCLTTPAAAERQALETILQDDAELLHGPDEEIRAAMAQVKEFGVERIRVTAGWSVLTRGADSKQRPDFDAADPAAYEQARWAGLDRAVRLANEHGLAVMIDVGFWAPLWATEDTEASRARTRPDPRAYADFAVAIARRYDGTFVPPAPKPDEVVEPSQDETFLESVFEPIPGPRRQEEPELGSSAPPVELGPLPRVDVLSLWNEPNHHAFLQPLWQKRKGRKALPASPPVYRAMVHAAYPAVKQYRPDVKVLVGATSSVGDHTGRGHSGIPPLMFIRELACVDRKLRARTRGACAGFAPVPGDGWTHHPYSLATPPGTPSPKALRDDARMGDLPRLTRLLDRLVRNGRLAPALRSVWLTEYGYESRTYANRQAFGLDEQAVFLSWAEYLAWRNPRVKTYAQFLLRDLPYLGPANPVRRPQGHWESGLLFADGTPKPMAGSFRVGLHAERRGRRTELWGRVRGIESGATATVERQVGRGRWRVVASGPIGGREVLLRRVRTVRRAHYRMLVQSGGRALQSFTVVAR
jgi:hypothetical protein